MTVLGPAGIPGEIDYSATSFAISTQCTPITEACRLDGGGGFFCGQDGPESPGAGFEWNDVITGTTFMHTGFNYTFLNPNTVYDGSPLAKTNQSEHAYNNSNTELNGWFGVATAVNKGIASISGSSSDPNVVELITNSLAVILSCEYNLMLTPLFSQCPTDISSFGHEVLNGKWISTNTTHYTE